MKAWSDETVSKIVIAHYKKHRDLMHIERITHEDVQKNFSNSFKFIMEDERFRNLPPSIKDRWLKSDPEYKAYLKAYDIALKMSFEKIKKTSTKFGL